MKSIVFVSGGTGGHIYPALYLAEFIKDKDPSILISFIGRRNGIESKIFSEKFPFYGLSLPKASQLKPWNYVKAYLEGRKILKKLKPDLLIIFGSYISVPILLEAIRRKYPFFLHEQNVFPGKAIRLFNFFSEGVAISFLKTKEYLPKRKIFYTGNFVRKELLTMEKASCKKELGFDLDKKLLLVTGGSQGAKRINELVKNIVPYLIDMNWQILHQIGEEKYKEFMKDINEEWLKKGYRPVPFIKEIEKAICASDLAISRAGATTIYQFLVGKLPAIYIPYPYAKDNHQEYNAKFVVECGLGEVVKEKDLSEEVLLKNILEWNEEKFRLYAQKFDSLALPDARERFWEIIKSYLERRNLE
ncbi:MAG: UDP-N-acetylglucosamine--N-acetylmuramyl-(pentapeptide) pyrophosphoryl-undecaprenol N-acetylglucosamine transferase [Dictyoglomus sp.]|nr:UDP-N-acetylglucosamine--N-acetylmuramyl-(pentapeptide) pyrophosphoryl-undecaprenol N-acetylglucosamine transferase [Dictyoglomus sp.]MCX7942358.1 UDP-N-acetylglucosamine--N-acetylmuramyl-(pentapeptide) pyrophosphoryl-undecaprenol N-acetylglucosamine transferase [Dictyoglomaceae bacterium]MDW8188438.1 UDP-N-acetylglucosamine--N-acetylmuramyl-(pentapeptide) pyrophosphoryl-undecaprenol N-acetylglucosamine transferase [Dictyoglomus sp.]